MNVNILKILMLGGALILQMFALKAQNETKKNELIFNDELNKMIAAVKALHTASFEMISEERIDGEVITHISEVKMQYAPLKIFVRSFDKNRELNNEILYKSGENNNNALISPNGFPYINISLNPLGGTMRNGRHLTLLEAGGVYLAKMLALGNQKEQEIGSKNKLTISALKDPKYGKCYKLVIDNATYQIERQKVKSNETLRAFCFRLGIPEFKVMELNKEVNSFDANIEGKELFVPNFFAKRLELILRESDHMPMKVVIFDEQGLYASYTYTYFDVNPTFEPIVFDQDNPAYTF